MSVEGDESADDLPPVHDRRSDSVVDEREHFGRAVHRDHLELLFTCRFSRDNNTVIVIDVRLVVFKPPTSKLFFSPSRDLSISNSSSVFYIYNTRKTKHTQKLQKPTTTNKKGGCLVPSPLLP